MNFDLGSISIGWREALVGLIVLVALYMLVVLWRMRRLRAKSRLSALQSVAEGAPVEPALGGQAEAPADREDRHREAAQIRLAQETFMRGMEDEIAMLREEVDALRGEVAALRQEMSQEVSHMRAAQTISPLYNDAMQMAQIGHDAATIAERCGIARAEAELVVALVKSQNN